jgi:hypothetical protein
MSASESIILRQGADRGLKVYACDDGPIANGVVTALRDGSWRDRSVGPLELAVLLAAAIDVATTAYVLYSPAYWEGNRFVARFAEVAPALGLAVFAGYCAVHVAVAWHSFGWLSMAAAGLLVVSMGVSVLNNVVRFVTGLSLYGRAGASHATLIHVVLPATGHVVGIVAARRRGAVPWREVAVVTVALVVVGAVEMGF